MSAFSVPEAVDCLHIFIEQNQNRPYPNYKNLKMRNGKLEAADYPRAFSLIRNKMRATDLRLFLVEAVNAINQANSDKDLRYLWEHRETISAFNHLVHKRRPAGLGMRARRVKEAFQGTHMGRKLREKLTIYLAPNHFQKRRMDAALQVIEQLRPTAKEADSQICETLTKLLKLKQSAIVESKQQDEPKELAVEAQAQALIEQIRNSLTMAWKRGLVSELDIRIINEWADELELNQAEETLMFFSEVEEEIQLMLDRVCWNVVAIMLQDLLNKRLPRIAHAYFWHLATAAATHYDEIKSCQDWLDTGMDTARRNMRGLIANELEKWGSFEDPLIIFQGTLLRLKAPYALANLLRDLGFKRFTWSMLQHRLNDNQLDALAQAMGPDPIDEFEEVLGSTSSLVPKPTRESPESLLNEYKVLQRSLSREVRMRANVAANESQQASAIVRSVAARYYSIRPNPKIHINPLYEGS